MENFGLYSRRHPRLQAMRLFFKPQRCNRQGLAKTRNRAVSRFSLEMAGSWERNIHQCPETPHAVSRMPLGLSAAAFMRPVFRSSVAAQRISYCHVSTSHGFMELFLTMRPDVLAHRNYAACTARLFDDIIKHIRQILTGHSQHLPFLAIRTVSAWRKKRG